MTATVTAITSPLTYVAVANAEDVTALAYVQVPISSEGEETFAAVELIAAATLPATTDRGIQLGAGKTILADKLQAMWASGALYARLAAGSIDCEVAVEGVGA